MNVCAKSPLGGKVVFLVLALSYSPFLAKADLFVSDTFNDVVDHYNASGSLVNSSSILGPTGLALGPDGNLYVATPYDDGSGNGCSIVTFNPATGAQIGTFASHVSNNDMNNPAGIAFDPAGNLYVGDLQSKILVFNSSGGNINELTDFNINAPSGLTFASGVLYVADEGGSVLSYSGGTFSVLNTSGAFMNIPYAVAVGADGNLYVLDISGSTGGIYQLNPATGFATEIVDYSTSFFDANDLVVGPDGKLYVSGVDGYTNDGEILQYATDGSGGGVYLNLGPGAEPGDMAFSVPEPSALALMSMAGIAATCFGIRRTNTAAK